MVSDLEGGVDESTTGKGEEDDSEPCSPVHPQLHLIEEDDLEEGGECLEQPPERFIRVAKDDKNTIELLSPN